MNEATSEFVIKVSELILISHQNKIKEKSEDSGKLVHNSPNHKTF